MGENYIRKAKIIKELPDCFIKRFNEYSAQVKGRALPVVPEKFESVLKKFNIEHSFFEIEKRDITSGYFKYWDKEDYSEEEVELPVYEFRGGRFYYIGTRVGKIPTKRSVRAAMKLKTQVDAEVQRMRDNDKIAYLRFKMEGRAAAVFDKAEFRAPFKSGENQNFYIFFVDAGETKYMVVFDLDKIYIDIVLLAIPKEKKAEILGESEENLEVWARELGVREIKVYDF